MDISRSTLWWPGWNGWQGVGEEAGRPGAPAAGLRARDRGGWYRNQCWPGSSRDHTLRGFRQHKRVLVPSWGQKPKFKASAGLYSFWMVQGGLFPGRFQFLGSGLFLHRQSISLPPLALLPQLFFLTLVFLFPS